MKKLLIGMILVTMLTVMPTQAQTINKYTTQKVSLLNKVKGEKVCTVKRNTELKILKEGKTWARVRYKGKDLSVKKKYLNAEKLLGKKKSRYYINYLHTKGPVHWRGRKYTYYTSRLCPIYKLPVPGLHLDKDGFWCDKRDYIVLGSSVQNKINRTVYATPFGKYGKVYDTGGYSTPSWLCDVATSW